LYVSPNIINEMKSGNMRRVGHVAHMEEMRSAYKILVRKPEGTRTRKTLRVDVRMILE